MNQDVASQVLAPRKQDTINHLTVIAHTHTHTHGGGTKGHKQIVAVYLQELGNELELISCRLDRS